MTQVQTDKDNRGGSRKGAGRKPTGTAKLERLSLRLSDKAADNLRRATEMTGKSRQQLINEWAETL